MHMPEAIVFAMPDGCAAVKIYALKLLPDLQKCFIEEYEKVLDLVEKEDGSCTEKENRLNPFRGVQIRD